MQDSSSPVDLHQNVYLSFYSILEDGGCKQTPSCAIFQNIAAGQMQNLFSMTNNSRHFGEKGSQLPFRDVIPELFLKKLSRLSDTKIDTDKLFDFDIQGQVH